MTKLCSSKVTYPESLIFFLGEDFRRIRYESAARFINNNGRYRRSVYYSPAANFKGSFSRELFLGNSEEIVNRAKFTNVTNVQLAREFHKFYLTFLSQYL